ncbi:MAG: hypothetical protein A2Z88_10000 [Omnitrophica WOR_2 bacterium GWA2_47_8]|nr:MAG: hypothetical protein A2Z88_10000 [Omnitrophica WOR_2 bacterium GWA2_47_8]
MKLNKISYVLLGSAVIGISLLGLRLRGQYFADQAVFNVDIVEHELQIYNKSQGEYPAQLSQLPDFDIVSYKEGLACSSKFLKTGSFRGYAYAYQKLAKDKFVLSASPNGALSSNIEFGITEKGDLGFNTHLMDEAADTYEEVLSWEKISRFQGLHSR